MDWASIMRSEFHFWPQHLDFEFSGMFRELIRYYQLQFGVVNQRWVVHRCIHLHRNNIKYFMPLCTHWVYSVHVPVVVSLVEKVCYTDRVCEYASNCFNFLIVSTWWGSVWGEVGMILFHWFLLCAIFRHYLFFFCSWWLFTITCSLQQNWPFCSWWLFTITCSLQQNWPFWNWGRFW
jgi:hypothetical protein